MPEFTSTETRFLKKNEIARLATVSADGMPHVVPVSYIFRDNAFLIAVDYETKKLRNIRRNRNVALVVDGLGPNRAVMVQGQAEILEKGSEFVQAYELFYKQFSWVRADPWKEGEAPFIRINPAAKASWGLR